MIIQFDLTLYRKNLHDSSFPLARCAGCRRFARPQAAGQDASAQGQAAAVPGAAEVANPLVKIDNVVGTGKEATAGNNVMVNYTGWFYKPLAPKQRGRKFDSSLDAGREPLDFQLGAGRSSRAGTRAWPA